jgi:formylglycine-generating enzyme required for sulfatase activity
MKKGFFLLFASLLINAISFSQSDFIQIKKASTVIGNDKFRAVRKSFTGVAGERENKKLKYYRKEHYVTLDSYKIKKYLVTNKEFAEFLSKSRYKTDYAKRKGGEYKEFLNENDFAVKRISFFDAIAYCQWISDCTGKKYRLPTSAEWEYAALAGKKDIFPWGNEARILPSTNTDSVIGRENLSVFQVKEDISAFGMANLMGGVEYTLDCYDDRFYENSPVENPVCLIPRNAMCVMRGVKDYNNLENEVYGLYDLTWNSVDSFNGYSYFRVVEDMDTVFNKGTIDESVYNPNIGIADKVKIYAHPQKADDFYECECVSRLFILFESTKKDFYRCFVQTYEKSIFGDMERTWKIGWIPKEEVSIIPKKWYED